MHRHRLTFFLMGLIVAAFAAVFIVGIGLYLNQDAVPLFSTNVWHLTTEDSAQILWQSDVSCLKDSRVPNGALAMVGPLLVFHQNCAPGIAVLKAIDRMTGTLSWWARSSSSSQLVAVADGLINVEDSTRLVRYLHTGSEVWRSVDFPAQSILRVIPNPYQVYVIQTDSVALLSLPTGEEDASGPGDTLLLTSSQGAVRLDETGLEVYLSRDMIQNYELPQALTVPRESIWLDMRESMLFISPTPSLVKAYDLATEQTRWTIETEALSAPILGDDEVYIYTAAHTLDAYDLQTGERTASIGLERVGGYTGSVELAYEDHIVVLAFPDSHEIIAVKLR